ncbi:hypothetical protein [Aquamicrobium defluvii]|uniref:Uncharacterized protein n=1 Tax=Aquamicrobium defluvii TaxID=69279 RepID=A0A011TKB2_9HYPH|nr:hypothetical protein [Aquamicrobium defluvii]EXL04437.1 hypothetical protein BG36_09945 [Aquamicrobium defluvii]EZQ14145.1 hypothetical protein CF98_21370 [Halopseudomonas bauzanensis]TDR34448.1 hypothetical protein DES43_11454 [Aquamicrobium defluvii]
MNAETDAAARYFSSIAAALSGLEVFLRDDRSPLYRHDIVASVVAEYIARLEKSFSCWRNRLGFQASFRISRAESGFPVFQNVLELENDRKQAEARLATIPQANELRQEMADFILRNKEFPEALQRSMAERLYLEDVESKETFGPFTLAQTVKVSVNPKSGLPYYLVHWASFDGTANLPLVYMATVEDSSESMVRQLVDKDRKLNGKVEIPLPVDGLLNPELAHRFDDFTERNSAYSLSPITIASNLDKDFETLHPKQLRRVVLGPFYSAGITENNSIVNEVLGRVRMPDNAWLLTWTVQEVFSKGEKPGRRGLFSSSKTTQEFHIETDDLEATRQGVSAYENHALVPHEAYQALYAAGETQKIFAGYKVHILSNGQVISDV